MVVFAVLSGEPDWVRTQGLREEADVIRRKIGENTIESVECLVAGEKRGPQLIVIMAEFRPPKFDS